MRRLAARVGEELAALRAELAEAKRATTPEFHLEAGEWPTSPDDDADDEPVEDPAREGEPVEDAADGLVDSETGEPFTAPRVLAAVDPATHATHPAEVDGLEERIARQTHGWLGGPSA